MIERSKRFLRRYFWRLLLNFHVLVDSWNSVRYANAKAAWPVGSSEVVVLVDGAGVGFLVLGFLLFLGSWLSCSTGSGEEARIEGLGAIGCSAGWAWEGAKDGSSAF